jgi:hypothetical protein
LLVQWVVKPIVGVLVAQTALQTCHLAGFYPEVILAQRLVGMAQAPSPELIASLGWGLAATVGLALLAVYENRSRLRLLFKPTESAMPAESRAQIPSARVDSPRDIFLRDAIWRVHLGKWSRNDIKGCTENDLAGLREAWHQLRQEAFDGTLVIWGKVGPVETLFEAIPKTFWKDGNVVWEAFKQDESLWAIPSPKYYFYGPRGRGNYSELKTSKAQIDALWSVESAVVRHLTLGIGG